MTVTDTKCAAKKVFFDQIAAKWDKICKNSKHNEVITNAISLLGNLSNKTIVDVGCGTGILELEILPYLGNGSILAIDISESMIEIAKSKCLDRRIVWCACDIMHCDIEEAHADYILCYNTFPHLTDHIGIIENFYRWLKPEGRFLIWHDCGRDRISEIHKSVGYPIGDDVLPPVSHIEKISINAGFCIIHAMETETQYFFMAQKSS